MAALFTLLSATLPVFLIAALGFFAVRRMAFDVSGYVRLVLYFFVPFLVFDQVRRVEPEARLLAFALAFFLTYLGLGVLGGLLARALSLSPPLAKTLIGALIFPNTGNMGLSLAFFAFGEAGLARAVIYFLLATLLLFGLGPALYRGSGVGEGLLMTFRLPFFWALLAAGGVVATGWTLPLVLERPVALMGTAAIPMLLFGLGMQIGKTPLAFGGFELGVSLLRLFAGPLLGHLAGRLVGLSGLDLAVFTLISGMPAAVNTYMLAAEFGGDPERAARVVALSTLLAFFTVPAVLALVGP